MKYPGIRWIAISALLRVAGPGIPFTASWVEMETFPSPMDIFPEVLLIFSLRGLKYKCGSLYTTSGLYLLLHYLVSL